MINVFNLSYLPMKRLAKKLGAEFILLKQNSDFLNAMHLKLIEFENSCSAKYLLQNSINTYIQSLAKCNLREDEYIAKMYDVEYTDIDKLEFLKNKISLDISRFKGRCNYSFLSPLFVSDWLMRISGYSKTELEKIKICDVGSGSGELEEYLLSLGITSTHLYSIDVSLASIERQKRMGINAYHGTINILPSIERFDLIFLSYFIDYDSNQSTTFTSAINHANPGAKVILEGLLPARYMGRSTQSPNNTITRGRFAFEDVGLISKAFENLSNQVSRIAKLERLVVGERYVYSHKGFCLLPSYFLVYKII